MMQKHHLRTPGRRPGRALEDNLLYILTTRAAQVYLQRRYDSGHGETDSSPPRFRVY